MDSIEAYTEVGCHEIAFGNWFWLHWHTGGTEKPWLRLRHFNFFKWEVLGRNKV